MVTPLIHSVSLLPLHVSDPDSFKCSKAFSHLPTPSTSPRTHLPPHPRRVSAILVTQTSCSFPGLIVFSQESFSISKINCFPLTFWVILGFLPFHISWKTLGLMSHIVSCGCFYLHSLVSPHRNHSLQLPQINQSPDFHFMDININWAHIMCQAMQIVWWGRQMCRENSMCLVPR